MADDIQVTEGSGPPVATEDVSGRHFQLVKVCFGADGVATAVDGAGSPLPVGVVGTVPVSGSVSLAGTPSVNATIVGAVEIVNDAGNAIPVSGALTDAELRATAVPVSGPLTDAEIRATALPVTGAFTKAEDTAHAPGDFGVQILAVRRDADTSSVDADGDYSHLSVDEVGRLKVAAQPGTIAATTGNITANGQTVSADVSRSSNVMMYCTGTFSGVNCTFEGSLDGTNWFAIQAIRSNANTIELTTGALSAAPAYAWELSVNGLSSVRVRATAFTSGTQTWRIQPAPYATEPIPAAQVSGTQPVSGSVTATLAAATVLAGDVGTQYRANATGAGTPTNINSPATPAVQTIKGSAGRLIAFFLINSNASPRYLKVFNIVSPTLGTSSATLDIPLPQNVPVSISLDGGIAFATAITCAVTGGRGPTDNTAITGNEVTGFTVHA